MNINDVFHNSRQPFKDNTYMRMKIKEPSENYL